MRHAKKINHLGRTNTHRQALLSNMASSLIKHKRISTTLAKAKALRVYVEPLITKAKEDTTHSRRTVFSYLQDKVAVAELFREISAKIMDRPGGYTRILKTGFRQGDSAETCIIELVDYNENMLVDKAGKAKSTTRRSRRGGKKTATEAATLPAVEEIAKTTVGEEAPIKPEAEAETPVKAETVTETETPVKAEAEPETKQELAATATPEQADTPEKEN
ncbi:MAG: 50S ribosomal protein L17 [Bacteroidales bacterium]|jgi:large subunit ribosomal protein L17|nr:50S ribosomal protein L17 [Bacteroidales bacterium]